jgi:glycosyltransferase involved in cell wall biosynthesis
VGKSPAFYLADDRGFRAVDGVVALTPALAAQLRQKGLPAFACPAPVSSNADSIGPSSHDSPTDGDVLHLLICSADLSHPRKNLGDAVRAAGAIARRGRLVRLRAIGRRPHAVEQAARALPPRLWRDLSLEILGPRHPSEVRDEMRRADVLLLPSLYEEWGYVAVESILSGTPVAAFPVYPFPDMLAGGLGVVARALSAESLALAAEEAAAGPRGAALVLAGEQRFGLPAVGERLTAIWRGVAVEES